MVYIERGEKTLAEKNIEELFNEYPPSIVLPNGNIIVGRNKIIPNRSIEDLPVDIWKVKDWNNCNIRNESYEEISSDNKLVINHVIDLLCPHFTQDEDLIILDDGAHEIADLIYFESSTSTIHFIHCKYSSKNCAGCRKIDCDELFVQAMRSIHWFSSPELIDRIKYRISKNQNSKILYGSQDILEKISQNYKVNNWKFNIILAQPGFKIDQVSNKKRKNNNVYKLTIPMFEKIIGSNGYIEIWGS